MSISIPFELDELEMLAWCIDAAIDAYIGVYPCEQAQVLLDRVNAAIEAAE